MIFAPKNQSKIAPQMNEILKQGQKPGAVSVDVRIIFLRVGTIETHLERYDAQVAIEARWSPEQVFLTALDPIHRKTLDQGECIPLVAYKEWHPQIFVLNRCVASVQETIHYSLKRHRETNKIEIREHRVLNGLFRCSFHLQHYPNDIQQLDILIGSTLSDKKVHLQADPYDMSGLNRDSFVAAQQFEWVLYKHVDITSSVIEAFIFQNDQDGTVNLPTYPKKRTILTSSCHIARKSKYFLWNYFFVVFLLSAVGFTSFAITPDLTPQRLGITSNLLLTQISFRWAISVSHMLPPISYLTIFDKYAIASVFVLIVFCCWHAIIGWLIFTYNYGNKIVPDSYWLWLDRYICFGFIGIYVLGHVIFFIWRIRATFREQKGMRLKEMEYRNKLDAKENLTLQGIVSNYGMQII